MSSGEGLGCGFDLGPCGAFAARLPGRGGPEHRSAAGFGCRRPALGFWRREERSGRTAHERRLCSLHRRLLGVSKLLVQRVTFSLGLCGTDEVEVEQAYQDVQLPLCLAGFDRDNFT